MAGDRMVHLFQRVPRVHFGTGVWFETTWRPVIITTRPMSMFFHSHTEMELAYIASATSDRQDNWHMNLNTNLP